jgi:cytidine deaminase
VFQFTEHIVTHMTNVRQRLVKHSPAVALATVEIHQLLGNEPISTHFRTTEEKCFPCGPCRGIIRGHRRSSKAHRVQRGRRMERVLVICEVGRLAIAL